MDVIKQFPKPNRWNIIIFILFALVLTPFAYALSPTVFDYCVFQFPKSLFRYFPDCIYLLLIEPYLFSPIGIGILLIIAMGLGALFLRLRTPDGIRLRIKKLLLSVMLLGALFAVILVAIYGFRYLTQLQAYERLRHRDNFEYYNEREEPPREASKKQADWKRKLGIDMTVPSDWAVEEHLELRYVSLESPEIDSRRGIFRIQGQTYSEYYTSYGHTFHEEPPPIEFKDYTATLDERVLAGATGYCSEETASDIYVRTINVITSASVKNLIYHECIGEVGVTRKEDWKFRDTYLAMLDSFSGKGDTNNK